MDDRETMLRRLRGLAAKTTDRGCTEEEAFAAAEMLSALLDRYGFDHADVLGEAKESVIRYAYTARGTDIGNCRYVSNAVAAYCDVKHWYSVTRLSGGRKQREWQLFGREPDVMFASYLMTCFYDAMVCGWHIHRQINPIPAPQRAKAKESYELGIMSRLSARLAEMKVARNAHVDPQTGRTGGSIVVVKNAEVETAYQALGLTLSTPRSTRARRVTADAYNAGRAAGDKVRITTGIGAA